MKIERTEEGGYIFSRTYFYLFPHKIKQMLKGINCQFYKVKEGQTLSKIAAYFCVSPRVLARENGLVQEVCAGQILKIPLQKGNAYTVKAGDDKALLCGSVERFEKLNGTSAFYIGMRVRI